VEAVIDRLRRLEPSTARHWGTLTSHEMVCHLGDAFRATLGEKRIAPLGTAFQRTVIRWIALHTPIPWPKGVPTTAEVDPRRGGTRPVDFERDRAAAVDLIRRFAAGDATYSRHPFFGALTRREWLIWGYRHADHHLRQFGL
jgi:hypothetical protein